MPFPTLAVDLESLRCFEAAATSLNFRSAAAQVGLSPAAFSDRIRKLEDRLDARLFERTTRSVGLSPAGERLLPQARLCLTEALRCGAATAAPDTPEPIELTLGTRHELGMSWLVPQIGALEAMRPGLRLHLAFGDSDALVAGALQGRLDAVITSARLTAAHLEHIPLHQERYAFVARPTLVATTPLSRPEDCSGHQLIDVQADLPLLRYLRDALPGATTLQFKGVTYLGTIAAIRHQVLGGAGVAVLPRYFVADDLRGGALVEVMGVEPVADWFRLVWRRGHPRSETLADIAAHLRDQPLV